MKNMKKMSIALAGIILAGSMGWSQIPARAATNGEIICSHENKNNFRREEIYDSQGGRGHIVTYKCRWYCPDCDIEFTDSLSGFFETHDFTKWELVEDRGDGLYRFERRCTKCGYDEDTLSDDPNDPKE